ncbi:MAG: mechanosensitive ion channel [Planctomycetota bacterium]
MIFACAVVAQDAPQPQPAELTIARVNELKEALPEVEGLDEETRAETTKVYDHAITSLTTRNDWRQKKRQFETAATSAPENLKTIQDEIAALPEKLPLSVAKDAELSAVESALENAKADATAANELLEGLKTEATNRETARKELPDRAAKVRLKLASPIEEDLLLPREGEPTTLADARVLATNALRAAQSAEAEAIDAEVDSYVKRTELLAARTDLASRRKELAQDLVTRLQELATSARKRDAEREAEKAAEERRKTADSHPVIKEVATENDALAQQRVGDDGIPSRISKASETLTEANASLEQIQQEYARMKERVERVGMTDAVGLMLRRRRDALPSTSVYEDRIQAREEELANTQLRLLDVEDRLTKLRNLDEAVATRMQDVELAGQSRTELENRLREQLKAQAGYLESLRSDYDSYLTLLVELDGVERAVVAEIDAYRDYVDERVLRIRSAELIGANDLTNGATAFAWLLDPDNLSDVASAIQTDARRHPFEFAFTGLLWLAVLGVQLYARKRIRRSADIISKNKAAPFWLTIQAFVGTIVISLPVSLAFWLVAWRLDEAPGTGEYGRAIASGLQAAALLFLGLSFLRNTLRREGLGDIHFGWSKEVRKALSKQLTWLLPVTAVLAFLIATFNSQSDESYTNSAGRIVMMIQLGAATVFMHFLLRPEGPLSKQYAAKRSGKLAGRGRTVAWLLALLLPFALAVLAAVGFAYTAGQLVTRYVLTLLLILGVVMLNGLMHRWFDLSETRIAIRIRKRKQKRKGLSVEEQKEQGVDDGVDEVDLLEVRKQTTSLRRSVVITAWLLGVFFVWLDVLPALGFLDQVQLWTHTGTIIGDDGSSIDTQVPVTLGNLLLGILFVVLTFVGARTVPGFLETTILQRLRLSAGIRYAFKSISRYVIAAAGTVIAFRAIGIGWADVQWLVAGFSVGLGFGLQEIFANFVSGLILLIERPVRVGDTVTVNNITGRVTRINMRATTIEDWDVKELIVPNKAFITTEIINWSLSSEVLRLVIKVGVAYGSDLKKVEETLLRVAKECSRVVNTPPPHTMFSNFGDSTLDFELRCFVSGINDFRFARDEINKSIDKAFHEEGIEIAFPQRTLWVRDFQAPLKVIKDLTPPESTGPVGEAPDDTAR